MDELVLKLAKGKHPIVASRAENSVQELKKSIERGYVLIKFPDTRGGTELGIRLDENATDLNDADFAKASGNVRLEGDLTLNYVPVRCIADVDLETLNGYGHLEIQEELAVG